MLVKTLSLVPILVFSFIPTVMNGAELKAETAREWDNYIESLDGGGQKFLPADRLDRVRRGEIYVAPAIEHGIRSVPGGLIHHWTGAAFLPGASNAALRGVLTDYARYRTIFKPMVVDSRVIECSAEQDRFSMRWAHRAMFVTAAMDMQYRSRTVRIDDRRGYIVSQTTGVQEIENYRRADERLLAPGHGLGLIWKLESIARYEERDGGVYLELEAIALSRDIPASVRMVVRPFVAKMARESLTVSLQQIREAVCHPEEARLVTRAPDLQRTR